ncbi:hypothetical protein PR202_ga12296 [Eleusine coracana subsp. coracana]|uniref:Uncharacterized protein n=1 Tax=Eleusine coracana subsp. coracana TaxID=191504 RepID=A0AAV5CBQ3_ELECO|nr:hypothetical protein PR202_ga12296 [Eleusine coracana subsp. coracana]
MNLILGKAILKIPDTVTGAFGLLTDIRLSYARLEGPGDGDDRRLGHLLSSSCSPQLRRAKLSFISELATLRLDAARTLEELQLLSLDDLQSLAVHAPGHTVLRIDKCSRVTEARVSAPQLKVLAWDHPCNNPGQLRLDGAASVRCIEKLDLFTHHHRTEYQGDEENDGNSGAVWLLRNCTHVNRLVVHVMFPYWLSNVLTPLFPEQEYDEAATEDIQDAIELIMPELPKIENLTVNIYPWVHTIGATIHDFMLLDSQIRLVGLLLASSPALERMTIALCVGDYDDEEEDFNIPCCGGHWEPYVWECSALGFIRPKKYEWIREV